ncbi:MAG TPA: hypothetical protein VH370_06670 [Humisphaera sp.]|nr:hypothetical protein [Humisphaera sp.]
MDAQAERERQESERLQWAQQQREAAQQLAAAAAPAPAAVMSYMAAAGAVPDYFGLRFGSMILRVFAMLYYLGGVVALIVAIVMMAAGSRSNELAVAAGFSIAPAFGAITLIGVGGMFHAGAEMCSAVRDIARNSFRK